jgi:hypothetical protein
MLLGTHMYPCLEECMRLLLSLMQGTDRDQEHLNIFLEFVPGGSIASLLTKFGAQSACHWRSPAIRTCTTTRHA